MQIRNIATFSVVAQHRGDLGVAVASKFLAVGSIVPWVRAGAGAVATQAAANVAYGPDGLALLAGGQSAADVLNQLLAGDDEREHRQVGIVDQDGRAAAHTGRACFPWAGHIVEQGFCCQGNLLAGEAVLLNMAAAFREARDSGSELAEALLAGLRAGDAAGGDNRGRQSAALLVVRAGGGYGGFLDRYIDLRVDDHPDPIPELERILRLHRFYLTKPSNGDFVSIDARLAGELQDALRDLGYYSGPNTNVYDKLTRAALFAYGSIENLEQRLVEDARIDRQVLDFIRRKREEARRRDETMNDEPGYPR